MTPWNPFKDAFALLGALFLAVVSLLLLYKLIRNGGPRHFDGRALWHIFGQLGFILFFGFIVVLMLDDPLLDIIPTGRGAGAHNFSLVALSSSMILLCSVFLFTYSWGYIRHLRQPKAEADQSAASSLSPEEKQALLDQLESDALWQQGERAVAAHMAACWEKVGLDDEWPTDQPLWERIDTQLHARYPSDDAQLAAYRAIQDRYLAIIRGEDLAL